MTAQGPLKGVRVLEFAGIGPAPFCAMLLSDMGADVLRIDRRGSAGARPDEIFSRGRSSLALDLKDEADLALCLAAVEAADVLVEGFRPGVMERLGLGPEVALAWNPRLIYGRMTGWGQTGPLAGSAGHDITYIAVTGALEAIGPEDGRPVPPLNLVGDYGGGALYLAFGIAAALFEARRSGRGQVVDAAIVDGVASMSAFYGWFRGLGVAGPRRGQNLLDGSAHYYRTYECADGRHVAVGAIEPQFYDELIRHLGLQDSPAAGAYAPRRSEEAALTLEAVFRTRTRDEWAQLFEGTDACVAPVLDFEEAPSHPHLKARGVHVEAFGQVQPAPAPRFSATPGAIQGPPPRAGAAALETLRRWGVEATPAAHLAD